MNILVLIILIPVILLGAIALNHFICKHVTKPYEYRKTDVEHLK